MRKLLKRTVAFMLTFGMLLQVSEAGIALAAEEADKAINPAEHIELTVPETLQDGNNYVFIRERMFTIGEKSSDKLYIPIQRTGDLSADAEVTLKLIDLTSHFGVNYTAEIYKDDAEPTIDRTDLAVIDLVTNADEQVEYEEPTEEELGKAINENGGADFVDADGNVMAKITASPADGQTEESQKEEPSQEQAAEDAAPTGTSELIEARNSWTGTISDRQEITAEQSETVLNGAQAADDGSGEEKPRSLVDDQYPGREYRIHFNSGEEAKFLVLTPRYSDAADGDSQLMLLLKDASENLGFPADAEPTPVNITDEDEPEPVTVSMAEAVVTAENGKAAVTVKREGRINAMVGVRVASWEGSAKVGEDYGGVGAKLYFPMGITERTIELPVEVGAEEKDFYVNITPVTDVQIGADTTCVVIPAANSSETGEFKLAATEDPKLAEPLNLRNLTVKTSHRVDWNSDTSIVPQTPTDKEWERAGIEFNSSDLGYMYDGVQMDYQVYANFCYARPEVGTKTDYNAQMGNVWTEDYQSQGMRANYKLNYYYGTPKSPQATIINIMNRSNSGTIFNDSYCRLHVYSVRPIKRKFNITVEQPEALAFEGMTSEEVLKEYESYIVNDRLDSTFSIYADGNFAISRAGSREMARLVGIDAVKSDGTTMRLATIDGKSSTAVAQLDKTNIDKLADGGFIRWTNGENEGSPVSGQSMVGNIKVRPVFEYVSDVTVEVPETANGTLKYNGKALEKGTHTFHYGDRLTFTTDVSESGANAGVKASGYKYTAKASKDGDTLRDAVENYVNGTNLKPMELIDNYYKIEPTFTEDQNQVVVKIANDDIQYFNQNFGLFTAAADDKWNEGSDTYYRIAKNVLTNQVYEMWAAAIDDTHVPVWKINGSDKVYSGSAFYITTSQKAADNMITLSVDRAADTHAYYNVTGAVYSSTYNLSSNHSANDMIPAKNAMVTSGLASSLTDADGKFKLVQYAVGGSSMRYTVTHNGTVNVKEATFYAANMPKKDISYAKIMPDKSINNTTVKAVDMNIGAVTVEGQSQTGAHFKNASVQLRGFNSSVINAVEMNGKELKVTVEVDPGKEYVYNQEVLKETVKNINFYFQNQTTGIIHGQFSTNDKNSGAVYDAATNTATLTIKDFSPNKSDQFTYGDALMVQLTTDKKVGLVGYSGSDMVYDPVSTGIAVITDQNYVPKTFDYDLDMFAEFLTGSEAKPPVDDEGKMKLQAADGKRASFGRFPFLGEITAMVAITSVLTSSSRTSDADKVIYNLDPDGEYDAGIDDAINSDGLQNTKREGVRKKVHVSVAFRIKETPYGGTRFMLGVVFTYGNGLGSLMPSRRKKASSDKQWGYYGRDNPFQNAGEAWYDLTHKSYSNAENMKWKNVELIDNRRGIGNSKLANDFGGPYFTFGLVFGIYLDYGYIELQTTDSSNKTEISHDMVFMGGGGYIGLNGTLGVTLCLALGFVPAYINLEFGGNATVFLGASANPKMLLDDFQNSGKLKGKDYSFNVEAIGNVRAALTLGIGWYKLLGIRASGGVEFEMGYSNNMPKWFPNAGSAFGYGMDATFSGGFDLVVTQIDLVSYSWPTGIQGGWMSYFREIRRANTLLTLVRKGITANKGSAEARQQCTKLADELQKLVDTHSSTADAVKSKTNELKDYAYDKDVISWFAKNRVEMNKSEGIIGNAMDGAMLQSADDEQPETFRTRDHVDSKWVADNGGFSLTAAQKANGSKKLVEDAFAQTSSRIMSLEYEENGVKQNENMYLVTFLGDEKTRDRQQASTLMYSVYDANTDTWTTPVKVQDDGTADSKPNLIDAGGKLILSWASIAPSKYETLKNNVKSELKAKAPSEAGEPTDEDALAALDKAPTRVMDQMDIFSVTFDKKTKTFGSIDQLTDDSYYDDYPEAVYDEQTGDYIVLYYKTAQDDASYTNETDRLKAMIGYSPDPKKTYSVLCYMLYNNQKTARDVNGQTHEAGWARDYAFTNETTLSGADLEKYFSDYKGQRFLSSTVTDKTGKQVDPPIGDMTAANGYNGIAAFAFTVDTDLNLNTSEDKDLYVRFYDFANHKTYVPIKVAGEITEEELQDDATTITKTTAVDVGAPQLIRNGGSTWLFWRENNSSLKYLNISELLNAKVPASDAVAARLTDDNTANDTLAEGEYVYAVKEDGTFAQNPYTGKPYAPNVQKVDFESYMTDGSMTPTEYQIITDENENLYVVWTDTITYKTEVEGIETERAANEIYASAMIKENTSDAPGTESNPATATMRWSKPYRLTTENKYNDGLALALDKDGGLIVVHNQYSKLTADTEEKVKKLAEDGKINIIKGSDGVDYIQGSLLYDSPIDLMVTRCANVGSLEATLFEFTDENPMPGEEIVVRATIENVGMTNAYGCDVEFYEYKNGSRGNKIADFSTDDMICVNTARKADFKWKVPNDGAEGYSIQAVIKEKKQGGGYYDEVTSDSGAFTKSPVYEFEDYDIEQQGDDFLLTYKLKNTGNADAEQGTTLNARLCLLHSKFNDWKDLYGVDDNLIYTDDISDKMKAGDEIDDSVTVKIPVSVFKKFGYDAIQLTVEDADGNEIERTEQLFVELDAPVNVKLNGGKAVSVKSGETAATELTYDSTVFVDADQDILYTVEDPSIASVDEDGNVTGLASGTTKLTAQLLPGGSSATVDVTVEDTTPTKRSSGGGGGGSSSKVSVYNSGTSKNGKVSVSKTNPSTGDIVNVTVTPDKGYELDKLTVTDSKGNEIEVTKNEDGTFSFVQPDGKVTVKAEYKKSDGTDTGNNGGNNGNTDNGDNWWFKDVPETAWYYTPIKDAYYGERMSGMSEDYFEPETDITRGMFAYAIYRREGLPETDAQNKFEDVKSGSYYETAIAWATENGIVAGYDDTHYGPDDSITREQMAAILWRYAQFKEYDVSAGEDTNILDFTDAADISEYAVPAIAWAVGDSVLTGFEDSTMRPQSNANRAQMAVILNKIAEMF